MRNYGITWEKIKLHQQQIELVLQNLKHRRKVFLHEKTNCVVSARIDALDAELVHLDEKIRGGEKLIYALKNW